MESLLSYLIFACFIILVVWLHVDDYRVAKRRRETLSYGAASGHFMTGSASGGFSTADFSGSCGGDGGGC